MGRKIIFAVDDTATMLSIIENALNPEHTVISLDAAEKIFPHLKKIKPDLILLDYYMPGMTCHEAMHKLKSDENHADIPVVIMSASNYPDLIDEIQAMGARDFMRKPFEATAVLLDKISEWTTQE
ncbi:MAG: response regulator [Defluviitaleaceae bacterium]|nr:response regulator [Defluviitaleaceae bacterium]MCL2276170.1 response regulator [Defluviitaleaceae bacterium]